MKLTAIEKAALENLRKAGGGVLTTRIPETTERDVVFGTIEPGMAIYQKLEKKGLVFFTEEDPVDDPDSKLHGFQFTNEIYLTEDGERCVSS